MQANYSVTIIDGAKQYALIMASGTELNSDRLCRKFHGYNHPKLSFYLRETLRTIFVQLNGMVYKMLVERFDKDFKVAGSSPLCATISLPSMCPF